MRILQLCKKFPYPFKDGESIAVYNLSSALNTLGCDITLLAMNTTKHYCDISSLPESFNHYKSIFDVKVNNEVQFIGAFMNLFSSESYHITRFISSKFENKLVQLLKNENFDIVQLETPILSHYIPIIKKYSKAKIVMRSHNVEHEIWGRIAENANFLPKKWYLKNAAAKLKRYEVNHLNQYDSVLSITERDRRSLIKLGLEKPVLNVPIGLNSKAYNTEYTNNEIDKSLSIGFIGSLDWMPNIEGLKWFLENAWSTIHNKYPHLKLHIAGRNAPAWLTNMNTNGVIVHGEVPCAKTFIRQHPIMIVPLLSGSGMRVKILEGMALGRAVISTEIGLEGIEANSGTEVIIAKTAKAFVDAIGWLQKDRQKLMEIQEKAIDFIKDQHDNLEIARKVLNHFEYISSIQPTKTLQKKQTKISK